MAIAQLSIDMVAKLAEFEKDLKRATAATEAQTSKMALAFEVVKGAAAGVAGALSVGAIVGAVHSVSDYADEMGKMSQKVGVAVEDLSALAYAAKLSDVSNETLGKGLKKLSVLMQEAAGGSAEASRTLKALGTAETQDVNKALFDIADRFEVLKDGAGKTALAAKGFGEKIGPELIPLLNGGGEALRNATEEARKFGRVVTKEAAAAAEKFNDNLTRLSEISKGVQASMFAGLVEGLGNAGAAYIDAAKEGSKYLGVIAAIQTFLTGDDRHKNNVALVEDTDKLLRAENALAAARASGMNPQGIAARQKAVDDLNARLKTNLAYRKLLDEQEERAKPKPRTETVDPGAFASGEKLKAMKSLADQGATLTESLLGQASGLSSDFFKKWDQLNAAYNGSAISLDRLTLAQAELLKQQPFEKTSLESAKKIAEDRATARNKEYDDINEWEKKRLAQEDKFWSDLLAATPTAKLEVQRATIEKITKGFLIEKKYGAPDSAEAAAKYGEVINAYLNNIPEAVAVTKSAAEELGLSFSSAFEDAIVSGNSLSVVLEGLEKDILRIALRKSITEPAAAYITGGISSILGSLGLPSFAVGTDYVPQDMIAKIHKGEKITPAAQNAMGSNGAQQVTVVQNFTVGDVASISMVRQAVAGSERRIVASMGRSRNYGGALS
jgi:hypothetical protein